MLAAIGIAIDEAGQMAGCKKVVYKIFILNYVALTDADLDKICHEVLDAKGE